MGDIPAWVLYAITGACIGVVLSVIGFGLQKAGFAIGRYLVILVIFFTTPITERVVIPAFEQLTWSDARTRSALMAEMPLLLPYLEQQFPDDYSTIIRSATALVRSAPASGPKHGSVADIVSKVRHKYAPFIKFASDDALSALLSKSIEFHQRVFDLDGAALCGRVAMEGPMALVSAGRSETYVSSIDDQSTALFMAIRGGIDTPTQRPQATDSDWERVGAIMVDLGATLEHFNALDAGDASSTLTCPALILMMKAMNSQDAPGAPRASFLADASAS